MMKKITTSLALICSLFLFSADSFAQTGLLYETVSFSTPTHPNQTREIYFYVPANYSATKKYKLFVSLHGQGSDPASYLTTFSFMTNGIYGNAILVSPTEGQQYSGFTDPAGEDDGILDLAISEAKYFFNIDPNYIYLTGFSLGARSGLKLGLNDYQKYRGLMLFTPAVQSLNEAKNLTSYKYIYSNGKFIPICMTVGANDAGYLSIDTEVQNQLLAVSAKSKFKVLSGVGHNVPQTLADYTDCYNFIEANVTTSVNEVADGAIRMIVYPNPAQNSLVVYLDVEEKEFQNISTTIINLLGQPVSRVHNSFIDGKLYLNLEGIPDGIYIVQVATLDQSFVQKIIIEN